MTTDNRIVELRRRVQEDPASLVFAQLAEEHRRAGDYGEAVAVCHAGLVHHPANLTARVTLARALIELDKLDEAFSELTYVLDAAPGNLPAIRALAEIYQRRGMLSEALAHYRRALQLAQHDTELSQAVGRIEQAMEPKSPAAVASPRVEELFDFDSLLAQLGPPSPAADAPFITLTPAAPALGAVVPPEDDALAAMERRLREREEARTVEDSRAREAAAERRRLQVLLELEDWLAAIARARQAQPSA